MCSEKNVEHLNKEIQKYSLWTSYAPAVKPSPRTTFSSLGKSYRISLSIKICCHEYLNIPLQQGQGI